MRNSPGNRSRVIFFEQPSTSPRGNQYHSGGYRHLRLFYNQKIVHAFLYRLLARAIAYNVLSRGRFSRMPGPMERSIGIFWIVLKLKDVVCYRTSKLVPKTSTIQL